VAPANGAVAGPSGSSCAWVVGRSPAAQIVAQEVKKLIELASQIDETTKTYKRT
jgi:hypothetical protein